MNHPLLRLPFVLFGLLVLIYNGFVHGPLPEALLPVGSAMLQTADPGVIVDPVSLNLTEGGAPGSYTIILNSIPDAPVTINIAAANGAVTASPGSVTFDPGIEPAVQTITVEVIDDEVASGPRTETIQHTVVTTDTTGYAGISVPDVTVNIAEDDTAGVTVTQSGGSTQLVEGSGSDTYTVALTSQPEAEVVIEVNPDGQVTAEPGSLTFTAGNWAAAQTVTVTAVDDAVPEASPHAGAVMHSVTSLDSQYNGLDPFSVTAQVMDNDGSILLTVLGDALTYEDPAQPPTTLNVKLSSEPSDSVDLNVQSLDASEGEVVEAMPVTLTPANWSSGANLTVEGADDSWVDGNIAYTIQVSVAGTTQASEYLGVGAETVQLVNHDDEVAGIILTPASGLVTTEAGGTATFEVKLTAQPAGSVTLKLTSTNTAEGTVSPASMTFTPGDWNAPRLATVTGQEDNIDDGNAPYNIQVAVNPATSHIAYHSASAQTVSLTNEDDDTAGVSVTPTSGLETSEAGTTDSFTIVLTSSPIHPVNLTLESSKDTEGTISPAAWTFDATNWYQAQEFIVTGKNDPDIDGTQPYQINITFSSSDPAYNTSATVAAENLDNDVAGIIINPATRLQTSEAGGEQVLSIYLSSRPTASVRLGLEIPDSSEGIVLSPDELLFIPDEWDKPQTATIKGVNDFLADGDVDYTVTVAVVSTTDSDYRNLSESRTVTNIDNDTAGITLSPSSGLKTTEKGGTASFTFVLDSQPTNTVQVSLSIPDDTEGKIVSPASKSLTIEAGDWRKLQIIEVEGVDDSLADGDQTCWVQLNFSSDDSNYTDQTLSVAVVNEDDDTANIRITPTDGLFTAEDGATAVISVTLASQPTKPVILTLRSSNESEGIVLDQTINFTSDDWDDPHPVRIKGVDDPDPIADGDIEYTIEIRASSEDDNYDELSAPIVTVINRDNDAAGLILIPDANLITSENERQVTFLVSLKTRPLSTVILAIHSSDETEGIATPTSLEFTSDNWYAQQLVTVTGVDDSIADRDVSYDIELAASSNDGKYKFVRSINAVNLDNDTPGVATIPLTTLETTEKGGTAVFTITLNTEPSAAVTIRLEPTDPSEGIISHDEIIIPPNKWDELYQVSITGIDDSANDGHVDYMIDITVSSTDPNYNELTRLSKTVRNLDDDGPSIDWISPVTTSGGGNILYIVPPAAGEISLEVNLDRSRGINFVYFYRWDIRMNDGAGGHVPIATVTEYPYRTVIKSSELHQGSNQIFVAAVDGDGNPSEHKRIILYYRRVFIPFVAH